MQLIIAEKPSVANDLTKVLPGPFQKKEGYWEGPGHIISWAVGHLLSLAEPEDYDPALKRWSLESLPILPETFERKPRRGQTKQLQTLKKLAHREEVEEIVNACDAAREGELIFREIEAYLGTEKPVQRLWIQSMTREALRRAFEEMEPASRHDGLGAAAFCRAEADWLIGMNATRGITRRLKGRKERGVWSAGRVQTPTLGLLVHRELAVLAHIPVPFWRLRGEFRAAGNTYKGLYRSSRTGKNAEKIWDEETARKILESCSGRATEVVETVHVSSRKPPLLHSLTSLQKEANSRFGLSARRTLGAAQRLYEQHKALTYPRTDSNALPSDYRGHVQKVIEFLADTSSRSFFSEPSRGEAIQETAAKLRGGGGAQTAPKLRNESVVFDDSRVADHFAIIPTGVLPDAPLGGDDAKVFELAVRRFLAAFLPPSKWEKVVRETRIQPPEDERRVFFTESNRLVEPGWQGVDRRPARSELLDSIGVSPGETAVGETLGIELEEDATRPPSRYTEAGILKAMESASDLDLEYHDEIEDDEVIQALREKGLGTPATRADIIEALIAKGYAIRMGKTLRATAKGITLIDFLQRIEADHLAKAELTAEMEFHLHQVEEGKRKRADYMREIEKSVKELIVKLQTFDYEDLYRSDPPLGECPLDGAPIREALRGYRCSKVEHGWTLWKEFRGRYINRSLAKKLLDERDSGPLEGFVTMRGRPYSGRIRLSDELQLEFEQVAGLKSSDDDGVVEPELASFPVDPSPFLPCPRCDTGKVVETSTHFECHQPEADGKQDPKGKPGCGLVIPRLVCKRELTRADVTPWLSKETAATEWIDDFISRKGRPFTARLIRKENGHHGFEFKPREKRKAASPAGKKAEKKGSPKKKAAKKKVVKKKAAKKKASKTSSKG